MNQTRSGTLDQMSEGNGLAAVTIGRTPSIRIETGDRPKGVTMEPKPTNRQLQMAKREAKIAAILRRRAAVKR